MNKLPFIRNKNRNQDDELKDRSTPEYSRMGIEPEKWDSPSLPKNGPNSFIWDPSKTSVGHSDRNNNKIQIEDSSETPSEEFEYQQFRQNQSDDLQNICDSMPNTYFILIDGAVVTSGVFDDIQQCVSELIFGTHELCKGEPVPADSISVIKKVDIRVGVFMEG